MKIIYCCFGGAHTSVTCASIHLGFLPQDRIPQKKEFGGVPFYDKMENKELGSIQYVGRDEFAHDIYIMGAANARPLVANGIYSYLKSCDIPQRKIILVNALVELNPITSIGGIASRRLHLIKQGRPMTVWGIRKSYPLLVQLVLRVKETVALYNEFS
jgi:hypothetical protein